MFFTNTQRQNCVSVGLWAFLGFTENLRRIFLVHSLVGEMGVGLSHKSGSGKKKSGIRSGKKKKKSGIRQSDKLLTHTAVQISHLEKEFGDAHIFCLSWEL